MKKLVLLCAVAFLASVSIGCTSSGGSSSSWCRMGSLFPVAGTTQSQQRVYMTAGSYDPCNPCEPVSCAPCEPACSAPCEPVCSAPCDPACDPCVRTGVFSRGRVLPGPM